MRTVTVSQANQHFSKLFNEAAAGEEILITRRGRPMVKMICVDGDSDRLRRAQAAKDAIEYWKTRPAIVAQHGWSRDEIYDEVTSVR